MANYANLGQPLKAGKSNTSVAAIYTGSVSSGYAASLDTAASANATSTESRIQLFTDTNSLFTGFVAGGDIFDKAKSCSLVKSALSLPVRTAASKTFTIGEKVGLNASGEVVPTGDADLIVNINAVVSDLDLTCYALNVPTQEPETVSNCIAIDLYNVEYS